MIRRFQTLIHIGLRGGALARAAGPNKTVDIRSGTRDSHPARIGSFVDDGSALGGVR
jgi:hypothetical protein